MFRNAPMPPGADAAASFRKIISFQLHEAETIGRRIINGPALRTTWTRERLPTRSTWPSLNEKARQIRAGRRAPLGHAAAPGLSLLVEAALSKKMLLSPCVRKNLNRVGSARVTRATSILSGSCLTSGL